MTAAMTAELELAKSLFPQKDARHFSPLMLQACSLALEAQSLPNQRTVASTEALTVIVALNLDEQTYIATLLSDLNLAPVYSIQKIQTLFGANIAKLVAGIRRLNQFKEFDVDTHSDEIQTERLRQMLLAMTEDIRIMLVKLAYRVARLRHLKFEDEATRKQIAAETQLIFAPLANRLGLAQLKWELEDLSFRYLEPETYKTIAQQLADKRIEREAYIQDMVIRLKQLLAEQSIEAHISGRPKHIYSIWKKMSKKQLTMDALYDLRALRVYVDDIADCYRVLGIVHSQWNFIPDEFDDYITSPKENGYQSIHTVIIGPQGKTVEIQIRTHQMHQNAEHGVAAHWKYKEDGKGYDANLEASIANIRQLLESRTDAEVFNEISTELQCKNIYVLTPKNEIITLPQGATPLDFAYAIHSELGHRCRGAKINGKIAPLTYPLKTGDNVEVLALKSGEPNRNWLNPNLGYLKTSRARTRIKHWFNRRNKEANIEAGEQLFNKEIKRLNARQVSAKHLVKYFRFSDEKDFYEALGKGQLNERQLTHAIQKTIQPVLNQPSPTFFSSSGDEKRLRYAYVVGASHLRTQLAPCCEPQLDDEIVGYVTRGRGVTVHRADCANILNLSAQDSQRLIEVTWSPQAAEASVYLVTLHLLAFDRKGLLRDVMSKLTEFDVNLVRSNTQTHRDERTVEMELELEVDTHTDLGKLLDQIEALSHVEEVSLQTHSQ